jgi:CheY-like chemotaxis protein
MSEATPQLPAPPPDGQYRVLVIEDDPFIARLILTNLNKVNFNCRVATDGIDGMAEFKSWDPHLVLSDIMMPGMDGRQVCSIIRSTSMVPIILITAADTSEAELAAFKAGADDYVPKPFDPKLLMTRVMATMRRVYRYDAQAHTPSPALTAASSSNGAGTAIQAPQPSAPRVPWITCGMCGHSAAASSFRQENARGQRLLMCPHCQEREQFTYGNQPAGGAHGSS